MQLGQWGIGLSLSQQTLDGSLEQPDLDDVTICAWRKHEQVRAFPSLSRAYKFEPKDKKYTSITHNNHQIFGSCLQNSKKT